MRERIFDWRRSVGLDLRSLALFRIFFGFFLFLDISYRALYIPEFYTDKGVLPRGPLLENFLNPYEVSVNLISGLWGVQAILFALAAIAALGIMFGYFTRLSAFICWVLVCSIQVRNQVVLHGGDDVIRLLLFWCQFLPLAAEFSLDNYLNKKAPPENPWFTSIGTAGVLVQICSIYFFTALLKWHPIWHTEGSAVYYALSLDQFTSPIGKYLLQFPEFIKVMTFMTVALEFFGPISALIPFPLFNWRLVVAAAFISFHLGLVFTMELGLFPWVCMSAWLMFLPSFFWDRIKPISFLVQNYIPRKLAPLLLWGRYLKVSPAPRLKFSLFNQAIGAIFLGLILYWNMTSLDDLHLNKPQWMRSTMSLSGTYQKWSMFAPYPRKDDGWYVMEGTQLNGQKVDLWSESHVLTYDKPTSVADTFRNSLWRKYLTNVWLTSYNGYRLHLGRFLCRSWNDVHKDQEQVNTILVTYMMEMTPAPRQDPDEIKKEVIWRHYCFNKPADWE
jgi:hypothetical protein